MTVGDTPIRICLIGAGRAGRVHANSISRHIATARLAAVVESVGETCDKAVADFGIGRAFADAEAALDWGQFDAVVITTPTFTHRDLAVAAARAGKHVFVEKPMALSLAECDDMIAAAEKAGVALQIGFMRRFDPEFSAAKARIDAGEIGRPMLIKSLTHGPGLPPPWARDPKLSNGMLAEVNSHDWDAVRWLMGSDPARVMAETANFKGRDRGVDDAAFYDTALVSIRFEDGGLGSITGVCPCDYGYDARVEIVGEKGLMQIGHIKGQSVTVVTDRDAGLREPVYRTWPERFAWGYIREMEHFVDCIRSGVRPSVTGLDGRWAVASVLAATRSFQEERPVKLAEVMA
ncbi:MAG TPA: Gfo/Idh/MocA family oxidoreductase [Bauldia sp.]|nr:Gfo/Idh/MocA family oxidoreductase [Bauldia sp.]